MKKSFLVAVFSWITVTSLGQSYLYSSALNGTYESKECYRTKMNGTEKMIVSAPDSEYDVFMMKNTFCGQGEVMLYAADAYSSGGYVGSYGEGEQTPIIIFKLVDGRVALVIEEYQEEDLSERIYYRVKPLNPESLEEMPSDEELYGEEEYYDEEEYYEGEVLPGLEVLPIELADFDWFMEENVMCFTNQMSGKTVLVAKCSDGYMGVELFQRGEEEFEIICYFYGDVLNGDVTQWRESMDDGIVEFEDRFEVNTELTKIYFNRLAYEKIDCE